MRIATYNVEWFSNLFDKQDELLENGGWSGRYDVTKQQQIKSLGTVFKAINADAIMIIEAPDTGPTRSSITALENFARRFKLRQNKAISGFANHTQQEISLLFDPKKITPKHDPIGNESGDAGSHDAPRFDGAFLTNANTDDAPDPITFSKPPLELSLQLKGLEKPIRLIGVHAKSKAPHGAKNTQHAAEISISNRRKQLAQCMWIRQRVDYHLEKKDHLVVLGDFNDGAGLDEYEKLFGHSSIEIVLGTTKPKNQQMHDPHASEALRTPFAANKTTSRFYDHRSKTYLNALLDYIMISPDLRAAGEHKWTIWHPFDHPTCYEKARLKKALLLASDHFPVTIDLDLG